MGLHTEQLGGRTQQRFFSPEEAENFVYPWSMRRRLHQEGGVRRGRYGDDGDQPEDPRADEGGLRQHRDEESGREARLAVGILNRVNLTIEGSLGYFGCGLIDGPNIRITGRVGWSCGENMMAGTIVIEKNAGSTFGAAIRGGDLVCRGDVGARTGIDQKGGTIIVGGRTGAFSGFMMQRGRMVILGDAGKNLGDSMYDGHDLRRRQNREPRRGRGAGRDGRARTSRGSSASSDLYGLKAPNGVKNMQKIAAGKQLWNYDNLEPAEKKLVL